MPRTHIANRPISSNVATQPNNPPTRSRIGNWDVAKDLYLLGILKDQQLKGNGASGNFPASSWMIILEEFKRNSSMEVKKENLLNRLKVLKQLYYLYHALANRSGWTWDHQNSMPIAPEETEWPDIIAANKNYRKIKGVPFPQYNDMDFLCGKNIAVGRNGISTNMEDIDVDGSTDGDDNLDDVHIAEEVDETLASGVHVDHSPAVAAETESAPSVISLKRRRSVMPSVSSRRIKLDKSDALDILVDVGKQNADLSKQKVDIAKEFLAREVAARPTVYSVKDCMRKLQTMLSEGLSMKQFIAGSEAIEDECKRDVFMELEGIPLLAWLARQAEVQDQHKPHKDHHFNSPEKMASQSSSFGIIGVGYSRLSIQTRIAISLINDEDDDNFNEMLVQYIAEEGLFYERHLPRPCRTRPFTGHALIQDILAGHEDRGYDLFRMSNQAFFLLRDELVALDAIRPTRWLGCDEQLAIFLHGIGHSVSNRVLAEMFQHSGETISRHFNNVLNAVLKLRSEYIKLPNALTRTHPRISSNPAFHPYFKNALGAIDGTHIPAIVREHKHARYRCRKNFISQNVMAAVSFDHTFMYVSSGWEGSAADMKVLRWALESGGFSVPDGKYYLVDSGYANTLRFLAPYRGIRYHLSEYRTQRRRGYRSPRDKYNHRHAQLRNAVEKTFGILKRRFKILRYAVPYPFRTQAKLVLACCIIHNFIARHQGNDRYFNLLNGLESWDSDDDDDEELDPTIVVGLDESRRGDQLRAWITNQMVND